MLFAVLSNDQNIKVFFFLDAAMMKQNDCKLLMNRVYCTSIKFQCVCVADVRKVIEGVRVVITIIITIISC